MTGSFSQNAARKPSGYGKAPHRADISLHIEFRIAAGTEDAVENGGVDRLCHQVQTAEEKHVLQIFCRGIGKRSEVDDCRRDQHQKTAGHNADGNCKMRQAAAVFACFLEFICTEQVSDQNTGTAAHTADQQERRLFAIEVIEFAATASLPMWPMITEYRT